MWAPSSAAGAVGVRDRRDHAAEVARDEGVGEGAQEGAERAVAARGGGELLGALRQHAQLPRLSRHRRARRQHRAQLGLR